MIYWILLATSEFTKVSEERFFMVKSYVWLSLETVQLKIKLPQLKIKLTSIDVHECRPTKLGLAIFNFCFVAEIENVRCDE